MYATKFRQLVPDDLGSRKAAVADLSTVAVAYPLLLRDLYEYATLLHLHCAHIFSLMK